LERNAAFDQLECPGGGGETHSFRLAVVELGVYHNKTPADRKK
jgi:hypothetical protein